MIFEEVKIVSELYSSFFVTLPLFIGATAFGTGAFLLTLYALGFLPSGRAGGTLMSLGIVFLVISGGGGYLYTHTIGKVESAQSVPLSVIDSKFMSTETRLQLTHWTGNIVLHRDLMVKDMSKYTNSSMTNSTNKVG